MAPQDSFIEDEDDTCPLCIEEFDLSDRNFRPCPCGYQICQFCFNNIKQNMNSLCPACRRPYDDKSIQWKVVTSEEIAEFRSNIQKNQKKRAAEQRQKEVQKREAEKENRKNLVGVRVVQKNLVYVTGLNPTVREDELLKTLRKQEFFGQYGNIQKISISNRKSPDGSPSLGIYVTFEKKEEAQRCIQAVNGSVNGERTLKAQLGTTKYCSAWLRHEQCTNRQCMFLHELGDEEDSYTRQDLSSMNSINTQRPLNGSSSRSASRQQSHPPPTPAPVPTPANTTTISSQPMARSISKDGSENDDASALPSSANWARNPPVRSRRGSYATSGAASSPAISMSLPVTAESVAEAIESPIEEEAAEGPPTGRSQGKAPVDAKPKEPKAKKEKDPLTNLFFSLVQAMEKCNLPSTYLFEGLSLDAHPPLFDPRGGEKRRALRDDESRLDAEPEEQQTEAREPSEGEPESSGSLALGGEPEDREHPRRVDHTFDQRRGGPPPPIQRNNSDNLFGSFTANYLQNANPGTIGNRTMTPQQALYPRTPTSFMDHLPPGIAPSQSLFQNQAHNRQPSRFGFGNEGGSGGAAIKLASNPRLMAQQSSMMPPSLHSQNAPYYAASMPGPPPGLKSTGTPPAMFGHGFAGSGFGGNPKDTRDTSQLLQDIIRTRGSASSQGHDAGKHDELPAFDEAVSIVDALVSDEPIMPGYLLGPSPDLQLRSGTPSFPPGFGPMHGHAASTPPPGLGRSMTPVSVATSTGRSVPRPAVPLLPAGSPSSKKVARLASGSMEARRAGKTAAESPLIQAATPLSGSFIATTASPAADKKPVLHDEDFPALDAAAKPSTSTIHTVPVIPVSRKNTPLPKSSTAATNSTTGPSTPSRVVVPVVETKKEKADKKVAPGVLNITTTVKTSSSKIAAAAALQAESSPATESAISAEAFPSLPTPAPAVTPATTWSPVVRATPKTLRVVQAATAGGADGASALVSSHGGSSNRPGTPASEVISDNASVVSASVMSTSMMSASMAPSMPASSVPASRAGSPPPMAPVSRIGSAAVRTTTKSQQRKQRKQATKKEAATIANQPVPEHQEEEEIAPIMGRKKKQKKEKPASNKSAAASNSNNSKADTPTESREATSAAAISSSPSTTTEKPAAEEISVKDASPAKASAGKAKDEGKATQKGKGGKGSKGSVGKINEAEAAAVIAAAMESAHQKAREREEEALQAALDEAARIAGTERVLPKAKTDTHNDTKVDDKTVDKGPSLFAVVRDMMARGFLGSERDVPMLWKHDGLDGDAHSQLKQGPAREKTIIGDAMLLPEVIFTEDDRADLLADKVVRKEIDGVRLMVTPNGDCLRNLTEQEEKRFLDLQASVAKAAVTPLAYQHPRYETTGGFALISKRAVPCGMPGYFPTGAGAGTTGGSMGAAMAGTGTGMEDEPSDGLSPVDPVAKIQREEAVYWINQYVLPRLNLLPPSESASWQSMLADTGMPQAIGTSTVAPWIYHTPDMRSVLGDDGASSTADSCMDYDHQHHHDCQHYHHHHHHHHVHHVHHVHHDCHHHHHHSEYDDEYDYDDDDDDLENSVRAMSVEDAEMSLTQARRDAEALGKTLRMLIKKNRRLLTTPFFESQMRPEIPGGGNGGRMTHAEMAAAF